MRQLLDTFSGTPFFQICPISCFNVNSSNLKNASKTWAVRGLHEFLSQATKILKPSVVKGPLQNSYRSSKPQVIELGNYIRAHLLCSDTMVKLSLKFA